MERRDFIKLCSMTGLAVVAGTSLDEGEAEAAQYEGNFFANIHLGGGPDVTNICDPKGCTAAEQATPEAMNRYLANAIPSDPTSGVRWAPLSTSPDIAGNAQAIAGAQAFENYFFTDAKRMLIINGIDYQTNSHDVGARLAVTGTAAENSAAFGAVAAAALLPSAPMAFVGFGGYTGTGGLTAVTRLGNTDVIKRLAYPYRRDPNSDEFLSYTDESAAIIAKARDERFAAKHKAQRLPKLKNAMNTLYLSRLGQNELKRLVDYLPADGELLDGLAGAMQLSIAAYRAGLCVATSLSSPGGWDHHGEVDTNIANSLGQLFNPESGLPMAMNLIEDAGIMTKTLVTCTGDFGRTPGYNMGNGKDHWPIASMIVMGGANGKLVKPGVKGGTTDRHESLGVNATSGLPEEGSPLTIKSGHVHNALRRVAGVLESDGAKMQPMMEDPNELVDLIEFA